jgi:hypothetical protein
MISTLELFSEVAFGDYVTAVISFESLTLS